MHKISFLLLVANFVYANPHWDPNRVPKDGVYTPKLIKTPSIPPGSLQKPENEVLRVDISFANEKFKFEQVVIEPSGTEGLFKRALKLDRLGSYRGILVDPTTEKPLYYDSLGTGSEFRLLSRGLTFRFPKIAKTMRLDVYAEDPKSGAINKILSQSISPQDAERIPLNDGLDIKQIQKATKLPAVRVNIYAEGYLGNDGTSFFSSAQRIADTLNRNKFPGVEQFEIYAVYAPSQVKLGKATQLGLPVPERNSHLGLYYPYWDPFGRWYNVVYPTRPIKYRNAIGQVPYDYPIALIDDANYWGVGNFNELTAIPSKHSSFTYLLLHELGHYFGLNEEYEGGGKTELAFAPEIKEPWSQNITFNPKKGELKWAKHVEASTALPTSISAWLGNGPYGAYEGGYAETEPFGMSHKPGFSCTMEDGTQFCPICSEAIHEKIKFDTGN